MLGCCCCCVLAAAAAAVACLQQLPLHSVALQYDDKRASRRGMGDVLDTRCPNDLTLTVSRVKTFRQLKNVGRSIPNCAQLLPGSFSTLRFVARAF